MPFNMPLNPEDLISELSDKYFAMTPQGGAAVFVW